MKIDTTELLMELQKSPADMHFPILTGFLARHAQTGKGQFVDAFHQVNTIASAFLSAEQIKKLTFEYVTQIRKRRGEITGLRNELQMEIDETEQNLAELNRRRAIYIEVGQVAQTLLLQKLGEGAIHKVHTAIQQGKFMTLAGEYLPAMTNPGLIAPHVFVVQHNWASAFASVDGVEDAHIGLPYPDHIVFEFRISGRRVICEINHPDVVQVEMETSCGWTLLGLYNVKTRVVAGRWKNDTLPAPPEALSYEEMANPIMDFCWRQIRAICLGLEVKASVVDVVRAPYKLNRAREKAGKLPIYDFHIVNLAHRIRHPQRLPEPGDIESEQNRKRLHYVRGHYRHFDNSKTWINPHFRGDPDLGFIDKEYRL